MSTEAAPPQQMRFCGKLMQAWFRTPLDLSELLPAGLEVDDPHRAFVKVYELKSRRIGAPMLAPGFSQYKQVCVSVLTTPTGAAGEGRPARHTNLFMWEARGWAMGTGGLGWNKKFADIEITQLWPVEERYREPGEAVPYRVDVRDQDAALMVFDGLIDGAPRVEPPPLNGFYLPDEGGAALYELLFEDSYLGEPLHGHGTLRFGSAPYELNVPAVLRDDEGRPRGRWTAGVLGEVECEGFQDVMFLRDFGGLHKI
jgi:hypothetical protein